MSTYMIKFIASETDYKFVKCNLTNNIIGTLNFISDNINNINITIP